MIDHLLGLLHPLDIVAGPPFGKLRTALLESLDELTIPGVVHDLA
jgi:hypothetical protein